MPTAAHQDPQASKNFEVDVLPGRDTGCTLSAFSTLERRAPIADVSGEATRVMAKVGPVVADVSGEATGVMAKVGPVVAMFRARRHV